MITKQSTDRLPWSSLLFEKLRWTFQPPNGVLDLLRNGAKTLKVEATLDERVYSFSVVRTSGERSIVRAKQPTSPASGSPAIFSSSEGGVDHPLGHRDHPGALRNLRL